MRRLPITLFLTVALAAMFALPAAAARGGAPGSPIAPDAIWADGELLATIGQGALPFNGHEDSYDRLFLVPGQAPVSEAGPGNPDYNGGRWIPTPVTWLTDDRPVLTSYGDVMDAEAAGQVALSAPRVDDAFLCPLIRNQ